MTTRRQFLAMAASIGAAAAWAGTPKSRTGTAVREARELYPEGVASGDPDAHSVLLWTRRPFAHGTKQSLSVEVAEDQAFSRVVASTRAHVLTDSDWTCRVMVGNLKPARVYWYRFIDDAGNASRVGRTITAPSDDDPRRINFAFVSCQNCNIGAQHAYRRMIFEDERATEADRLGFVLHLGDFVYEVVWYPEDRPQGFSGRRVREIVRYPHGERTGEWHIPTTLEDYRALYKAYLHDADIQDARARWPFVPMWDNHEFSIDGWQSLQVFDGETKARQTRKVAALQAWFEFQPARVRKSGGASLDRFNPPAVVDAAITQFDANGLGLEPNNQAAIASLTGYRALRFGRHVELIITDQRSYRSEDPLNHPSAKQLASADFLEMMPQQALEILDAGRSYDGGHPPETIRIGDQSIPNWRKDQPPQTILGAQQKAWFLNCLDRSTATWKIWGNTQGTLDSRADPQNLPPGLTRRWPGTGFAYTDGGDFGDAFTERREIYDFVRARAITGFATVAGDRHSFWAGLASADLPPRRFDPVGVAFVTGAISSPGLIESLEHRDFKEHPLQTLYIVQREGETRKEPAINMLLRHGVRSCLEYAASGDVKSARRLSNPDLAPHLAFVDMGGHGYGIVRASGSALECEFVCIPPPAEHDSRSDGGPLLYRVVHRSPLWNRNERPAINQRLVEGNPELSI